MTINNPKPDSTVSDKPEPTTAEIQKWHDEDQVHIKRGVLRKTPEHTHRGILLKRLENSIIECNGAWLEHACMETRAEKAETKAKADDESAKHDIEHLYASLNCEVNRVAELEKQLAAAITGLELQNTEDITPESMLLTCQVITLAAKKYDSMKKQLDEISKFAAKPWAKEGWDVREVLFYLNAILNREKGDE